MEIAELSFQQAKSSHSKNEPQLLGNITQIKAKMDELQTPSPDDLPYKMFEILGVTKTKQKEHKLASLLKELARD